MKSKGELFFEAAKRMFGWHGNDYTWDGRSAAFHAHANDTATEYEKARFAELPADVTANGNPLNIVEAYKALVVERAELLLSLATCEQTRGEPCDLCGWAMKFPDAPCRCELEKETAVLRERLAKCESDERAAIKEIGDIVAGVAKELDTRFCDPMGNEPVWVPVRRMRECLEKLEVDNEALAARESQFAEQVVASGNRERELRERLAKLEAAAEKSFALNCEMIVYPDAYFREKWGFEETLAEIAADLGKPAPRKGDDT